MFSSFLFLLIFPPPPPPPPPVSQNLFSSNLMNSIGIVKLHLEQFPWMSIRVLLNSKPVFMLAFSGPLLSYIIYYYLTDFCMFTYVMLRKDWIELNWKVYWKDGKLKKNVFSISSASLLILSHKYKFLNSLFTINSSFARDSFS